MTAASLARFIAAHYFDRANMGLHLEKDIQARDAAWAARVRELEAALMSTNEEWDATDGAHPCWWRGHDNGAKAAANRIASLEAELREARVAETELRRQLTFQRENNHKRNLELDALHYVWCDGGCAGGVHRFTPGPITEEVVALAERNTKRLRQWWGNHKARDARKATP